MDAKRWGLVVLSHGRGPMAKTNPDMKSHRDKREQQNGGGQATNPSPARSLLLGSVVTHIRKEDASNIAAHWRRGNGPKMQTELDSRRSVQPPCSPVLSSSSNDLPKLLVNIVDDLAVTETAIFAKPR